MDDANGYEYRTGYKEAPKFLVKASVEMLAPTGERQQSERKTN
jgi:hypothetical protein